jgi:hypothetical protein
VLKLAGSLVYAVYIVVKGSKIKQMKYAFLKRVAIVLYVPRGVQGNIPLYVSHWFTKKYMVTLIT